MTDPVETLRAVKCALKEHADASRVGEGSIDKTDMASMLSAAAQNSYVSGLMDACLQIGDVIATIEAGREPGMSGDLGLVTTEELIGALRRRFSALIFAGVSDQTAGCEDARYDHHGSSLTALGLCVAMRQHVERYRAEWQRLQEPTDD